MPKPRKLQVSLDATPYYHCASRCVRRAFLCGTDIYTGKSYEHRRQWVEDRIHFLASVFAIDVCAYAVMHNHLHVVLHINRAKALHWTDDEVCQRWHQLYKGTLLTRRFSNGESLTEAEREVVQVKCDEWRLQLSNISWFMRALNEPIARMANAEDGCTGKFWEARFTSQALLDEKALAACLAYVDLNPVRARIAHTPETSEHTAIKQRLDTLKTEQIQPSTLFPFVGNPREPMPEGLPFRLLDYLELVEWSGRIIREDKRGFIDQDLPPILERLCIAPEQWLTLTTQFEQQCKTLAGEANRMREAAAMMGYRRTPGLRQSLSLFQ
ncbi:transposase [Aurantivibrio plasticivorans]